MPININRFKKDVISHKNFYISFLCVYVLAVIVGIIFSSSTERLFLTENIIEFYKNILTKSGNLSGLIFSRLFSDIMVFTLFFGLSFSVYLLPINYIIIFYRGYILGVTAGLFLTILSVSGIMLYIFAVLIPNIITSVCLIFFTIECMFIRKKKCKQASNKCVNYLFLSFFASLIGLVIELVFILFFIRPLNFNF